MSPWGQVMDFIHRRLRRDRIDRLELLSEKASHERAEVSADLNRAILDDIGRTTGTEVVIKALLEKMRKREWDA